MSLSLEGIFRFFDSGGPVFISVLIASLFLWVLVIERYWYCLFRFPHNLQNIVNVWQSRNEHRSWHALRIREGLISDIVIYGRSLLIPIKTITAILPLLGLLGTVTGMISIFDVMNQFSTGNARGMAYGISRALLPTIAGLVTALAGIYISSDLERRINNQIDHAKDMLRI